MDPSHQQQFNQHSDKKQLLITGASQRLGLFLTQAFAKQGWQVHALTRRASPELTQLAQVYTNLNNMNNNSEAERSSINIIEVGDYGQGLAKALPQLTPIFYRLNVLINNASLFGKETDELSLVDDYYQQLFEVHQQAPARLISHYAKHSQAQQSALGVVVNLTDIYSQTPRADYALYCSTKAGLEALTKAYALKYANKLRVNSIQPGPIQFLPSHQAQEKQQVLCQTPLAYEGGFQPILQAVLFLIENPYVTGSPIIVDGGRHLKLS